MSDRFRVSGLPSRRVARIAGLTLAAVAVGAWQTGVAMQAPVKPPMKAGEVVRVDAAEARRVAEET